VRSPTQETYALCQASNAVPSVELMEADGYQSARVKIDVRVSGKGEWCSRVWKLREVFRDCVYFRARMVDGDGSMVMPFLYYYYGSTQANRVVPGGKAAGVGSDGMIKMISLYLIYTHVPTCWFWRWANEASDHIIPFL